MASFLRRNALEIDVGSLEDLSRLDTHEKPPTLVQLREFTHNRFSDQWIKYMYAKFKNECPTGRMKFPEFKKLFGSYIPDRVSDAYLDRLFHAFCYVSPSSDQVTFKDLVTCLSRLCDDDARSNAEWTMRLISRENTGQIFFQEFHDFVKSIFMLVGRSEQNARKIRSGSLLLGGTTLIMDSAGGRRTPTVKSAAILASAITTPCAAPTLALSGAMPMKKAIYCRAYTVFRELDLEGKGYLTVENLETFFREKQTEFFARF